MVYRHRVTIRVTMLEGHKGTLTSSRVLYANDTEDIINPLDNVLNDFPSDEENVPVPPKPKKK